MRRETAQPEKGNEEPAMERDVLERRMVLWVQWLRRTRPPWWGRSAAMARIAGRFRRVEPRATARAYLLGLLSGVERKDCRRPGRRT